MRQVEEEKNHQLARMKRTRDLETWQDERHSSEREEGGGRT